MESRERDEKGNECVSILYWQQKEREQKQTFSMDILQIVYACYCEFYGKFYSNDSRVYSGLFKFKFVHISMEFVVVVIIIVCVSIVSKTRILTREL
jgi:hypothetical protein